MEFIKKTIPTPDYNNILNAAKNLHTKRVPIYEHLIDFGIMEKITGKNTYSGIFSDDSSARKDGLRDFWDFWRIMGYDTASFEFSLGGTLHGRGCLGSHNKGCIHTRDDFNKYPWDEMLQKYIDAYAPLLEDFKDSAPEGMKAVGGVANGIFECVQDIIGFTDLCYIAADDEELYADVFSRMGDLQFQVWEWFMKHHSDIFCVLRFGDDLGFKSTTLLSTDDVKTHIIPQYKRIVDLVHSYNKPFLLHSCGSIFNVMDDLINVAHIDAKHSNEDQIALFTEWVDRYGDKIGNFGGLDTDTICRAPLDEVRSKTKTILDHTKGKPGVAFATGNSIPSYVDVDKYVTMVETVRIYRGE